MPEISRQKYKHLLTVYHLKENFTCGVYPTPHPKLTSNEYHIENPDTYRETSSSFPVETHEMFPKIVSQWDVWLSNLPCRWQSAPKDKKGKNVSHR